jgi:hypothetical protein
LKKIADVPFLLRNILALQKMGIEKMVVWAEEPLHGQVEFLASIKTDQSLKLDLEWANNECILSLPEALSFLIFYGSTLLNGYEDQLVEVDADNSKDFPEELMQCLSKKKIYFIKSESLEQPERLRDEIGFSVAEERLLNPVDSIMTASWIA